MNRLSCLAAVCLLFLAGCSDDSGATPGADQGVSPDLGPEVTTSIKDIKTEAQPDGKKVKLEAVVVTAIDTYGDRTGHVYVQDQGGGINGGIQLFAPKMDVGQVTDLKLGDRVDVSGIVKHYTGPASGPFSNGAKVIQIVSGTVTKKGTGTPPEPTPITEAIIKNADEAKKYEGLLVELDEVKIVSGIDQYGQFKVSGGLQIDQELYLSSPTVGDCVTIRGVLIYFYAYRLNPRGEADVVAATGCKEPTVVTISTIQDPSASGRPSDGAEVTVAGVVTALDANPGSDGTHDGFWIQEEGTGGPYKGIYVFYPYKDSDSVKPPAVGNMVQVSGTYVEYYGLSEIQDVTVVTDQGAATAIEPLTVTLADIAKGSVEQPKYEGLLIKVENVKVKELFESGGVKGFKVDGADLEVYGELHAFADPAVGSTYSSIVGVLHAFRDKSIQLYPRQAADLVTQ